MKRAEDYKLIITALTLIVAAVTLYLQFFKSTTSGTVTANDFRLLPNGEGHLKITFTNSGSTNIRINQLYLTTTSGNSYDTYIFKLEKHSNEGGSILLSPGEIKDLTFDLGAKPISTNAPPTPNKAKKTPTSVNNANTIYLAKLHWRMALPDGRQTDNSAEIARLTYSDGGIRVSQSSQPNQLISDTARPVSHPDTIFHDNGVTFDFPPEKKP